MPAGQGSELIPDGRVTLTADGRVILTADGRVTLTADGRVAAPLWQGPALQPTPQYASSVPQ